MSLRVNQLTGFGKRATIEGIASYVDHGDWTTTGTTTRTATAVNSDGPNTIAIVTWVRTSEDDAVITSATIDGNSMGIAVQNVHSPSNKCFGCAILTDSNGPHSSVSLVINYDNAVNTTRITVISVDGVASMTPQDTDTQSGDAATISFSGLIGAGTGGLYVAAAANRTEGTAFTWGNATEISDEDVGEQRHGVAVGLDDPAGTVTATGANDEYSGCAASFT